MLTQFYIPKFGKYKGIDKKVHFIIVTIYKKIVMLYIIYFISYTINSIFIHIHLFNIFFYKNFFHFFFCGKLFLIYIKSSSLYFFYSSNIFIIYLK